MIGLLLACETGTSWADVGVVAAIFVPIMFIVLAIVLLDR